MYEQLVELFNIHKPDYVCYENIQARNNMGTFQLLAQLQGILMGILFQRDIGFQIIQPTQWRSNVGVTGRVRDEQKKSAIEIVKSRYDVHEKITDDECEAILIGQFISSKIKDKKEEVI